MEQCYTSFQYVLKSTREFTSYLKTANSTISECIPNKTLFSLEILISNHSDPTITIFYLFIVGEET